MSDVLISLWMLVVTQAFVVRAIARTAGRHTLVRLHGFFYRSH